MREPGVLWSLLVIFLSACQPNEPTPVNAPFERIQILTGQNVQEEFQTNQQERWVESRLYETRLTDATGNAPLLARSRYYFDDQHQLTTSEHKSFYTICTMCWTPLFPSSTPTSSYTMIYSYQNGLVQADQQEVLHGQITTVGKALSHINNQGQIDRVEQWYGYFGPLTLYETLVFQYDYEGNLSQQERFSAKGFRNELITYQYDKKLNPFQPLRIPELAPRFLSRNNIVDRYRRIFEEADAPGTVRQEEEKTGYSYNSLGFPTTIQQPNQVLTVRYQ